MEQNWEKLYRSAVMERNPTLQQLRIEDAYKAVIRLIKETDDTGERQRLDRAIEMLNILAQSDLTSLFSLLCLEPIGDHAILC